MPLPRLDGRGLRPTPTHTDGDLETLLLMLIGLAAGVLGGLLGIGGSLIMIPGMAELLPPNQHLFQATAMIVNVFVAVPAVYHHRKAGAIDRRTVWRLLPLAALSVVGGVLLSELPLFAGAGEAYLRFMFGLFLLFVTASELYRIARKRAANGALESSESLNENAERERPVGWASAAAVAIPTGLIAGLLGVGGGVLAVPLQRRFLGIPIRIAIANSATIIIATGLLGAALKNYAYLVDTDYSLDSFRLAAILIPTAVIGSLIGSQLTHRLPVRIVKTAFLVLMVVVAVRLTTRAAADRPRRNPPAAATMSALGAVPAQSPRTAFLVAV